MQDGNGNNLPGELPQTLTSENVPEVTKHLGDAIKENAARTDEQPNIYVKDPGTTLPNEAPMSLNGQATLKTPQPENKGVYITRIEYGEDGNTSKKKEFVTFKLLRIAEREQAAAVLYELFKELDLFDVTDNKPGLNLEKLNKMSKADLLLVGNYIRTISGLVTDKDTDYFLDVGVMDLLQILLGIFNNETGIISNIEDFLPTTETGVGGR